MSGPSSANPLSANPLSADLGHTRLDLDRTRRIGLPEAVYAAGKSPDQCVEIIARLLEEHDGPIVVTRTTAEHREALTSLAPGSVWSDTLTWRHAPVLPAGPVVVVSGGTSDQPVVDEAVGTLTALGASTRVVRDVGVAGLHRLMNSLDQLEGASVVLAVAGMEGSLPTVLAGLIAPPIIAVPTSTGYGSSFEGITALLSALSSCAPGLTVVGIDNGYGAACAAMRILHAATPTSGAT